MFSSREVAPCRAERMDSIWPGRDVFRTWIQMSTSRRGDQRGGHGAIVRERWEEPGGALLFGEVRAEERG